MLVHEAFDQWSHAGTTRRGLFKAPTRFLLGKMAPQLTQETFKAFNETTERALGCGAEIDTGEMAADAHKGAVQAMVLSLQVLEVCAAMVYAVHGSLLSNGHRLQLVDHA
jgi:hypothetical protein